MKIELKLLNALKSIRSPVLSNPDFIKNLPVYIQELYPVVTLEKTAITKEYVILIYFIYI